MMFIYNTTFLVEAPVHEQWLDLIRNTYIPLLHREGFLHTTLARVISGELSGQFTYSLQVGLEAVGDYRRIEQELFGQYETLAKGFGEQVLHFATLMKVVEEKE